MKLGRLSIDRRFLESRVARRVFAILVACAVVPVATFAGFAYHEVGRQLESDAEHAVRAASKAAGMGILERLLLADDAFRQRMATSAAPERPRAGASQAIGRVARLEPGDDAGLGPRERARLQAGQPILRVVRNARGVRIALLREREATGELWRAEVEPDFVFSGERRFAGDGYWVLDAEGRSLFASTDDGDLPALRDAPDESDPKILRADVDGAPNLVGRWPLFLGGAFAAETWTVHVARPLARVQAPLHEFESIFPWVVGITLCCAVGLALVQVRRTLVPIEALVQGARRVAVGDFGARVEVFSRDEFGYLSEAFNEMADVIERHIGVLATVNRIGAALSAQEDTDGLLDLILQGAMQVTGAEGGAVLLSTEGDGLALSRLRLRTRNADAPEAPEEHFPVALARRCLGRPGPVRAPTDPESAPQELEPWRDFGPHFGAPVASWLGLPMRDERGEALGVLMLVSRWSGTFGDDACRLAESLASQAAVAMRKNGLVESFRALFEGLIQLTVKAVDEKSPYTGDHCRKVPLLTELITDALCEARSGPYKDFDLSPDERYELRIAALLHDCGKVVTPVHVMDKSTKMETIFDRIELVSTRFEVLRRDAVLRAVGRSTGVDPEQAVREDEELARELAILQDDLAFLERANVGSEKGMPEAERQRVRDLASRYRWRTASGEVRDVLDADEVTNLTIQRGTLTEAEREIINSHVVTTIDMLEQLPFPRSLRGVPHIAGAHHERVDGTGYPKRLRAEQLGMQARILGLADVFEALTARDRPYKPGRTLSETLEILDFMCDEGHLDRELYSFFLSEGLHLRYAAEHVAPEQIDAAHWEAIERLSGP